MLVGIGRKVSLSVHGLAKITVTHKPMKKRIFIIYNKIYLNEQSIFKPSDKICLNTNNSFFLYFKPFNLFKQINFIIPFRFSFLTLTPLVPRKCKTLRFSKRNSLNIFRLWLSASVLSRNSQIHSCKWPVRSQLSSSTSSMVSQVP
jgi:hypothetical protein